MLNRILAALFCVLVFSTVSEARQSPRGFIAGPAVKEHKLIPVFGGKPVSKMRGRNPAEIAKRYLGTNPTKMRRLWCHAFTNMILLKAGYQSSGSNLARSGLKVGKAVSLSSARVGDLVVLARGKGGHSGFYLGRTQDGRVQLVSGNTRGRVVGISAYSPKRVLGVRRLS